MSVNGWPWPISEASNELRAILGETGEALQPPIRSEIFGQQRFAQHGRSLGRTHRAARARAGARAFFPRLNSNIRTLRLAHHYIGLQAAAGFDVSPAAEWLLDNFHLIEAQLKEIHEGLPRIYFRSLPVLLDEPLVGLPRIYGVAWAFVAHTDGAFDEELLVRFLGAYQETRALDLSEMWALPTTLRVVLIENLRRLAERLAAQKVGRELANLCCDRIDTATVPSLNAVLAVLRPRGLDQVFLAQMAQRLQDRRITTSAIHSPLKHWLSEMLPDAAAVQAQQSADQTADNLSVSNAVSSLRAIGDADWQDIVARSSPLMQLMLTSALFQAEHAVTRDRTLHAIERLGRRSGRTELGVAKTLLGLMHGAENGRGAVAGYWLHGPGRGQLAGALGVGDSAARLRAAIRALALPLYLGLLLLGTLGVTGLLLMRGGHGFMAVEGMGWVSVLGMVLMLFPASEAVVAVINRLVGESAQPQRLPRLALGDGLPLTRRTMVVIPSLLVDSSSNERLAHRLRLHYLANPEPHAQFALLTDWADADAPRTERDDAILDDAVARVRDLNRLHPVSSDPVSSGAPRFLLLHRARTFSQTEQRWIGWERKRGKLELLIKALVEGSSGDFLDLGALSHCEPGTRHVLTLDSDTQLPPGRLRELVGVAAHPENQPRMDPSGRLVIGGYGVLQPRVVTPLPALREFTFYHWLFAGNNGIDPYSAATSEVYQDVFAEGTFTGKGLLDVHAMHAVLGGRLPQGQVLSHDLLEGSIARCAAVTDVTVIEDAPFHPDVAASRVHRWTRGDWQLLPILLRPLKYPMRAVNRWKMIDNLRRSLVAPMSLALLLLSMAGFVLSPWAAVALVAAAFSAGPLLGAIAGSSPPRDDLAIEHFYRHALSELARAVWGGLWHIAQLLLQARMAIDAIVRALYRTAISRRHLLQWTTAAEAQVAASAGFPAIIRRHRIEPLLAGGLLSVLLATGTPRPAFAFVMCAVWAASPLWTWLASRQRPVCPEDDLPLDDQVYLECIARDTWRLFERVIGPEDNYLPPDNLQTMPQDIVAHRTSPTNIGLYLLSVACARQFGWIGTREMLSRMEATLATLGRLQRHRGHFLNWYDTQTCEPLFPMYVSTVDSGNLSGHLLAVGQACRERVRAAPAQHRAPLRAIAVSRQRLEPLLALWSGLPDAPQPGASLARLLAAGAPLADLTASAEDFDVMLAEAAADLQALDEGAQAATQSGRPAQQFDEFILVAGDYLALLRSAWEDMRPGSAGDLAQTRAQLLAMAQACERLAFEADFSFLYHPRRHLLHLGFRVAEQELDAGFYDLLASEARLTSLLAIAKGDAPVAHWGSLGRPFFALRADAGLRSWSGSMFEYLMPTLILEEPCGSVLNEASRVTVLEQVAFAESQHVPWGISESAYAGRDHTLAYQYAPQGVPRLALRRTPPDELVIAPYATALAAQVSAHRARLNFAALESAGARGRLGFIEALDFTAARQASGDVSTPVNTYMAHHQGMTIVALANVLLGSPAQRWGMANPHIEAVSSLLHERAPRTVSLLYAPAAAPRAQVLRKQAAGLLRELVPGMAAVEPTHLLSNGRYSVALRANGSGWSRRGRVGINRTRDDVLRDAFGSHFFLRWSGQPRPVSITQHPAPDADARYEALFHADRVCFDARWRAVRAHTTVWVSPEDDIEFRQVELYNLGERVLDIELMSAFEVTLSDPAADEAHPAFTSLFVRARWSDAQHALLFQRTPRLPTEQALQIAHFLSDADPQIVGIRAQTDRQRWLGRNHDVSRPLASLDALPQEGTLDTGLDPVCALAVRLRIAPGSRAKLTFATAASDNGGTLGAMIDKYRQASHVERASLMSATLSGIRLHVLRLSAANLAAIQTLTTALVMSVSRPGSMDLEPIDTVHDDACDRRLLWRFGISGDLPLVLVSIGSMQGLGMVRALAQALRIWSWGGVACDLVVVSTEPMSYLMPLQQEIAILRDRHAAESNLHAGAASTAFHVLRLEELSADEARTLQGVARLHFLADGRPFVHRVREWIDLHEQARVARQSITVVPVPVAAGTAAPGPAPQGAFVADGGEFEFDVSEASRPPRPWINVLSNARFGAQLSEAGGGYTWALNSRLNQLTAWSNDPVGDPPSEWFLLQDLRTRKVWSVAPSAWGDEHLTYRISHGQGYTVVRHRRGDLEVMACWCVDPQASVKQVSVRLVNHGSARLRMRLVGIAEWMMGANRSDRGTVRTAHHRAALAVHDVAVLGEHQVDTHGVERARQLIALTATQRERSGGFGGGTAFLAMAREPGAKSRGKTAGLPASEAGGFGDGSHDWTCDRRELFDARGRMVLPDFLAGQEGNGLDPCAVLSTSFELAPGEPAERVFVLGHAEDVQAARRLAAEAVAVPSAVRIDAARSHWDELLGATVVRTPDPLFDAMVNRWLLYQTVACRIWAKAGFYQAGGATGFRDQLQDSMALAWAAPRTLREQIMLCASRQFPEGDVQHWWHAPTGAGVRTHFSDDLLWLPHACAHYLRVTEDATLLDEPVPFIEGADIPEGAEDAYYVPSESSQVASVYEHAARTIDRSLRVGVHGLPLMGTGDWNDGMNRVGHEGRGESVWLGWFLCRVVDEFAPVATSRGDGERAARWLQAAEGWQRALDGPGWDGQWYRRAFFDDGQALGSKDNPEAKIDLIAQAWAVLSGAGAPEKQRQAMGAVEAHLVDHRAGLVRLLDPPLAQATPSAGYIQAYPPGVRENGGQYSHAGVWGMMAQAQLARHGRAGSPAADIAWRYFTWLSPAHRSTHPEQREAYRLEPYVMAGDIYSQPPYVGRGGWSWYTGSAAWMHRAAIESVFGLMQRGDTLSFEPCLPSHWTQAELTLSRDSRKLRFILRRANAAAALEATAGTGAALLLPGQALQWTAGEGDGCFVIPLDEEHP